MSIRTFPAQQTENKLAGRCVKEKASVYCEQSVQQHPLTALHQHADVCSLPVLFHQAIKRKKAAVEAEESETDGSPIKKKRDTKKKGWYFWPLIIIYLQLCSTGRAALKIQSSCWRLFISIVPLLFAELVKIILSWRYFQGSPAVQLESVYHLLLHHRAVLLAQKPLFLLPLPTFHSSHLQHVTQKSCEPTTLTFF